MDLLPRPPSSPPTSDSQKGNTYFSPRVPQLVSNPSVSSFRSPLESLLEKVGETRVYSCTYDRISPVLYDLSSPVLLRLCRSLTFPARPRTWRSDGRPRGRWCGVSTRHIPEWGRFIHHLRRERHCSPFPSIFGTEVGVPVLTRG